MALAEAGPRPRVEGGAAGASRVGLDSQQESKQDKSAEWLQEVQE